MRVAVAQIKPYLADVEKNLKKHISFIKEAKKRGAELVVFPELSLTGYDLRDMVFEVALPLESDELSELKKVSKEEDISIVVGFIEESVEYKFHIASAYIEDGKILHVHRKAYLPTYGMFEEQRYAARGNRIKAFNTKFGRMAILICEDMWHPSAAYVAVCDGAVYLLAVACSPSKGVYTPKLASSDIWENFIRTYSELYGVYTIFSNRVGTENGLIFWGGSEVHSPLGNVKKASYFEEELLITDADIDDVRVARINLPIFRDERLDMTLRELQRIVAQREKLEGFVNFIDVLKKHF